MQDQAKDFFNADGSIDYASAMAAGRRARSEAFHLMCRPSHAAKQKRQAQVKWNSAILPTAGLAGGACADRNWTSVIDLREIIR